MFCCEKGMADFCRVERRGGEQKGAEREQRGREEGERERRVEEKELTKPIVQLCLRMHFYAKLQSIYTKTPQIAREQI